MFVLACSKPPAQTRLIATSTFGNVDDSFGEGLWGFLRQIVPDPALDEPVLILAREFLGVRAGLRMWCAVGITFQRNGGHGDDRARGKPLFQIVIFRLALSQAEPPAVIMDHNGDVLRVVEGRRGAIERGIIEVHFGEASCQMSFEKSRRYLS